MLYVFKYTLLALRVLIKRELKLELIIVPLLNTKASVLGAAAVSAVYNTIKFLKSQFLKRTLCDQYLIVDALADDLTFHLKGAV
jgi:hypothetical protein